MYKKYSDLGTHKYNANVLGKNTIALQEIISCH